MSDRVLLPQPKIHSDLFSEADRANVMEFLERPGWEYGWKSNSVRDGFSFLHKHFAGTRKGSDPPYDCASELLLAAPPIWTAWQTVKDKIFKGDRLVRCYANGMAYGMDGTVHTDSTQPGNFTAVYYPHARWSPNWGGETLFYNDEETNVRGVAYPKPNSAVVFDGRMPHRAAGTTRQFPGMRITLMFKVLEVEVRGT